MRLVRRIGSIIVIGAGCYCLFVFFLILRPDIKNYFNRTEFDSATWKTWVETENTTSLRWDMVEDLKDDYELEGMTEQQIVDLLGEPGAKTNSEWTYYLGMARSGIDTGTLSMIFEHGKVKKFEVRVG